MSNINIQEFKILSDNRFNELCSVLGVSKQCVYAPERKVIEKAFRRAALKSHPDKGGDPMVFKKINDAYNKLIGHVQKLEQQVEAEELSNSILIEVSKVSVKKWEEKLNKRYGWHKTQNCKNIIFEGPYKQFMGRSVNTGNLTLVLYEDPPDGIPKIHVRSKKYMAWIAEASLPVHMHVEKGKSLQFDQWRIAHLAEFGINNFDAAPSTPAPSRDFRPQAQAQAPERNKDRVERPQRTPKSKRKEKSEREASERRAKTRRDSESMQQPEEEKEIREEPNKENANPSKFGSLFGSLSCGQCGAGFVNLIEYLGHKKVCIPDEDFGFQESPKPEPSEHKEPDTRSGEDSNVSSSQKTEDNKESDVKNITNDSIKEKDCKTQSKSDTTSENPFNKTKFVNLLSTNKNSFQGNPSGLMCDLCGSLFTSMVKYDTHRTRGCEGKQKTMTESSKDFPMGSLSRDLPEWTRQGCRVFWMSTSAPMSCISPSKFSKMFRMLIT